MQRCKVVCKRQKEDNEGNGKAHGDTVWLRKTLALANLVNMGKRDDVCNFGLVCALEGEKQGNSLMQAIAIASPPQ